jgi:hypothetical protein
MKIQQLTRALLGVSAVCFFSLPLAYGSEVSAVKSCREIASFIASSGNFEDRLGVSGMLEDLNCAAARRIPEGTHLELSRARWNSSLHRWEFVLRCARHEQCVPFLVWARGENPQAEIANSRTHQAGADPIVTALTPIVKTGETALLTWDGGGIRVVLPVTCLDAGSLGQTVRVRLKHVDRILRAEVVGAGALTAKL